MSVWIFLVVGFSIEILCRLGEEVGVEKGVLCQMRELNKRRLLFREKEKYF